MMFAKIHPVIRLNKVESLASATYLKVDFFPAPFSVGAKVASPSQKNCQRELSIAAGNGLLSRSFNRNSWPKWSLDRKTNYLFPTGVRTFVHVSPTEFYDIMGLTPKATSEQIKSTYFKLSKIYHPDVCKDPGGVEKFVLISKAYEVLGNEERRREYDRGILNPLDERSGHAASRSKHEFTEEDILRYQEIFNQHHDIPKSKRSQFIQRGKKKGIYDFDEYYKQHYQDEMKKQAHSSEANDNMNRNAEQVARARKLQENEEEDAPQMTGMKAFGPWIVLIILVYFVRKSGFSGGPF